jgi:hypothetical protein
MTFDPNSGMSIIDYFRKVETEGRQIDPEMGFNRILQRIDNSVPTSYRDTIRLFKPVDMNDLIRVGRQIQKDNKEANIKSKRPASRAVGNITVTSQDVVMSVDRPSGSEESRSDAKVEELTKKLERLEKELSRMKSAEYERNVRHENFLRNAICWRCERKGHIATQCPEAESYGKSRKSSETSKNSTGAQGSKAQPSGKPQ